MITMKEIDALRATLTDAMKRRRYVGAYDAEETLVEEAVLAVDRARADVLSALAQWWAQGCREIESPPPRCPGCACPLFSGSVIVDWDGAGTPAHAECYDRAHGSAKGARAVVAAQTTPPRISGQSPADKLADAADQAWRHFHAMNPIALDLRAAVETYRSTRNADPAASALFGSPPDPVLVARFLLDSLTGGALSSLICQVRDAKGINKRYGNDLDFGPHGLDNLRSNLRALGEKIDG